MRYPFYTPTIKRKRMREIGPDSAIPYANGKYPSFLRVEGGYHPFQKSLLIPYERIARKRDASFIFCRCARTFH